ncbi:MAG: ABC transporter ATP-binding protein, partial [Candidatus Eremiobacteraeota bacterium]|nr:ABC transporter ATP-binding protein [Candidatus Eremiobacteraeota bacterium]
GSGKTTALRALAGLLRPHSGSIRNGSDVWYESLTGAFTPPHRRDCAMVFARGALFGHMTALENVEFGLRALGLEGKSVRARALEALEIVHASTLSSLSAASLSGGEIQRVALARAAALKPAVLLLDEPLAALDIRLRPMVRDALRDTIDVTNAATVLVVHDPAEAMLFARGFVVIEDGEVAQAGDARDLRERPATAYIASFAGTNLYRGRARALRDGSSHVDIGAASLVVQGHYSGDVSVLLDPDAVTLSAAAADSSARNQFFGPVQSIVPDRGAFRITLASLPPISARVTAHSFTALEIRHGKQFYASFKAMEARVL